MSKKESTPEGKSKEFLVITKYPENYKIFDMRANKPVCYKASEEASMVLQEIDTIEFSTRINGKKNVLDYFAPNNVGVLLSIAHKSLITAKDIYDKNLNPDKVNHLEGFENLDKRNAIIMKSKIIYDFIELIQSSIVFGYTALEAFSNLSIPSTFQYKTEPNGKGIIEIYDKDAVERWVPLRTKISEILVDIYKTKSIKQKNLWNKFIQFEELRNEIIHQKSINSTNLYKKYFRKGFFEVCETPEEVIRFFFEERENKKMTDPLWPWVINGKNEFPVSNNYNPDNFEVTGNIFERRSS